MNSTRFSLKKKRQKNFLYSNFTWDPIKIFTRDSYKDATSDFLDNSNKDLAKNSSRNSSWDFSSRSSENSIKISSRFNILSI